MFIIRITIHILVLYLFYWVGSWLQMTFHLFIPGSVIGMLLFLILLLTKVINPKWLEAGASLLIGHLPLLFLPITVGAIEYLHLFTGSGVRIVLVVLVSTMLVMISSGAVSQAIIRKKEKQSI